MEATTTANRPLNIVISGIFGFGRFAEDHGRDELRAYIKAAGHNNRTQVNTMTDYLVVPSIENWTAYNVGPSKMAKAAQLGTKVITDTQLRRILSA